MKPALSRTLINFSARSTLVALFTTIGLLNTIVLPSHAQPDPCRSNNPSNPSEFWTPAARLDPAKPQRITIVNKTGIVLEYLVTTHTNSRTLAAGESATLSDIDTPLFLNINSQESNYSVKYSVSVDKKTNTLMVTVTPTDSEDSRALNINETGAVYLY
jgi:hypothetical protein